MKRASVKLLALCFLTAALGAEPWSTYRGSSQRTGNNDGLAGPKTTKVLWVYKPEPRGDFVAAPVPYKGQLFVSSLGAFNVSTFACLDTAPKASKRVLWSKTTPYLKLPTVSSPAIHDGKLVFGDGMHQTDGAVLHCLRADGGMPVWQLPVPGTLVHLEGSPTIAGDRVYLGGGAAGVLCVDLNRVTLEGKNTTLAETQKLLAQKWKELQAKYEADKKKDPDFAVPPSEDQLPKPAPVVVWQQGKEKWHVDAPVAVAGDRVLVSSAFLDKEHVGDRALFCLSSRTGAQTWRTPLPFNPWGGPSLSGDLVVIGGSTIGYDPDSVRGAKGFVAAYGLADGKEKWRKDLPGGVLSCVALTPELAIATATDGKVRAFDLKSGERRWVYDAKTPFFAPVAVAGELAYAGDLKGRIHAIGLKSGRVKWALDLGADAAVKAPGMIYSGPVVHGGRLFVATCNLKGAGDRSPGVVVCIGEK